MKYYSDNNTFSASIASTHEDVSTIIGRAVDWMRQSVDEASSLIDVAVILRELMLNAITHGSQNDERLSIWCYITRTDDEQFEIRVEDQGEGFDTDALFLGLPADPLRETTCGLKLVNALAEHLEFNSKGNEAMAQVRIGGATRRAPALSLSR